jgi:hypothetical protein
LGPAVLGLASVAILSLAGVGYLFRELKKIQNQPNPSVQMQKDFEESHSHLTNTLTQSMTDVDQLRQKLNIVGNGLQQTQQSIQRLVMMQGNRMPNQVVRQAPPPPSVAAGVMANPLANVPIQRPPPPRVQSASVPLQTIPEKRVAMVESAQAGDVPSL